MVSISTNGLSFFVSLQSLTNERKSSWTSLGYESKLPFIEVRSTGGCPVVTVLCILVIVRAYVAQCPPCFQNLANLLSFRGIPLRSTLVYLRGLGFPSRAWFFEKFHSSLYSAVALTIPLFLMVKSNPSIYSKADDLNSSTSDKGSVWVNAWQIKFRVSTTTFDS